MTFTDMPLHRRIAMIDAIDTALDLDSYIRALLMIDFDFDDLDNCIALDDATRTAELDAIDADARSNADSMPNAFNAPDDTHRRLHATALDLLMTLDRHAISEMRLNHSLCPMHAIDYAICFDDDDAECATIRRIFPNHDT